MDARTDAAGVAAAAARRSYGKLVAFLAARSRDVAAAQDALAEAFATALAEWPVRGVPRNPEAWLLTGGEDHGLLATFPAEAQLPAGFRRLGTVRAGGPGVVTAPQDAAHAAAVGWDHFRR